MGKLRQKSPDRKQQRVKSLIQIVCFEGLQSLAEIFLIIRRIQRDIINVHRSSCKVPVILSDFNGT